MELRYKQTAFFLLRSLDLGGKKLKKWIERVHQIQSSGSKESPAMAPVAPDGPRDAAKMELDRRWASQFGTSGRSW